MFDNLNSIEKLKVLAVFLLVQAATFGAGIYSGSEFVSRSGGESADAALQLQYTENSQKNPVTEPKPETTTTPTTTSLDPQNCTQIKGNISGKNKTYHVPGGSFYERTTTPEQCFATEEEAVAAGYTKSSR